LFQIELHDATFAKTPAKESTVTDLTCVNFFFGNNGTGKSTIAQAILNDYGITYNPGHNRSDYYLHVYDEKYIKDNIQSYPGMPGLFTMDYVNITTQKVVEKKQEEIKDLREKQSKNDKQAEEKNRELTKLIKAFRKDVWDKTKDIREKFSDTQTGFKNSQEKLADRIMSSESKDVDEDELSRVYASAFSEDAQTYELFEVPEDPYILDNMPHMELMEKCYASFVGIIESGAALEELGIAYENLPESPSGWEAFFSGAADGFLWSYGIPSNFSGKVLSDADNVANSEAQIRSAAANALANLENEAKNLEKLLLKGEKLGASFYELAPQYAAEITMNNGRIVVDFDENGTNDHDWLKLFNNGETLYDVCVIATITGKDGNSVTNYYFVERWEKEWLFSELESLELVNVVFRNTAFQVQNVKIELYSPAYSTSFTYQYDEEEKTKDGYYEKIGRQIWQEHLKTMNNTDGNLAPPPLEY